MDEEKAQEERLIKIRDGSFDSSPADRSSSGDDTFLSPDTSFGHRKIEIINPIRDDSPNFDNDGSFKKIEKNDSNVSHVDTAAPFESVKEAVSKFGAIVDWKAHRAQTHERRKFIEEELEKAREEIPVFKKKSEAAQREKEQALRDLDSTKRLIEELKLNLERAQTEERQAKQDSELAQLRVHEMEQGVAKESSVAAKTLMQLVKARHQAAASELVDVKRELKEMRKDYAVLLSERDIAIKKAQEAMREAKEIEREVENLTIQLITTKESIESTHAAHLEAEEFRTAEISARDQDAINYENELRESEEALEKVKEQLVLAKDLKSKLESASKLLHKLKGELAIYMQGKIPEEPEAEKFTRKDIQSGMAVAKNSLEEINSKIGKTKEEIERLKTAAKSLTAQIESEKATLTKIRKQKGLGEKAVVSLESELKKKRKEVDNIRKQEKEAREKLSSQLPKQLKKVNKETEKAKSKAEKARLALKGAKETAEEAKSGVSSISTRITSIQKEIDAARAAEKIALGAMKAVQDNEPAQGKKSKDTKGIVTLSLAEYYELSVNGHEAGEAAKKRVEDAIAQVDAAKDVEMQCLKKLTQLNSELSAHKEALSVALQRAETAKELTAKAEAELKKGKGKSDLKRNKSGLFRALSMKGNRDSQPSSPKLLKSRSEKRSGAAEGNSVADEHEHEQSTDVKGLKKKKKAFMPKFFMFMGKKKQVPQKNS